MTDHHFLIDVVVEPKIFREYIGIKDEPESLKDFPADIIKKDIPEFHFILGFAKEIPNDNKKGTGVFNRSWNYDDFSPAKVLKLKKDHQNVKVIISIGGHGDDYAIFDPEEKKVWIDEATTSIIGLIQDYEKYLNEIKDSSNDCGCENIIDGIDINYESINSDDFSSCIGTLIKNLKKPSNNVSKSMNVVSIAPTEKTQGHYHTLYWNYKDIINWIDYKFYDQDISSKENFVKVYNKLVNDYGTAEKFLAGVSTDKNDTKMKREDFIEGCTSLINSKSLPGIFVWSANDSAVPANDDSKPYYLEKILQNILTDDD